MVILAGGRGERLRPLTDAVPKPLLKVGEKPILEHLLEHLAACGQRSVYLCTCYKAEMIAAHCGDGSRWGLEIRYFQDAELTGTAGPLARARGQITVPFVVMNADLLTTIHPGNLMEFHRRGGFDLTVAMKQYRLEVPYGILHTDHDRVTGLEEKPERAFYVNAGIYALEPALLELVPADRRYDMTDLIAELLARGRPVGGFPLHEQWLDVGSQDTLQAALAHHRPAEPGPGPT